MLSGFGATPGLDSLTSSQITSFRLSGSESGDDAEEVDDATEAANTPLTYLLREHGVVTPEIMAAAYASDVDRHIATTVHVGRHYDLDNTMLYDELKTLVVDGTGWAFVRKFDKAKNGRAAVMALKRQAEGASSQILRKTKAYASIKNAIFRGLRKGHTFAHYVTTHQVAHNELIDLDEMISETKKVTDFLAGIQDPSLEVGMTVILSDPAMLEDFGACQQYLSTILIQTKATQAKAERHILSVFAEGGGGGGPKHGSLVDKLKGGPYLTAQYRSLSKEEKERMAKFRAGKRRRRRASGKRPRRDGSLVRLSRFVKKSPLEPKAKRSRKPVRALVRSLEQMATGTRSPRND
jgi:hypothetical protein